LPEKDNTSSNKLSLFDVTNLVVGSIIGADIYVAAALGAKLVGPFSLVIWLAAGLIAMVIALSFAYSAAIYPHVGGPYAYTREAFGVFPGFLVGWSLLLAEWFSLAVFPVAFTRYASILLPWASDSWTIPLKAFFIVVILATNVFGVKAAGRFNDYLTIGKLAPLLVLTIGGFVVIALQPASSFSNFTPFMTGNAVSAGQALVLIFWAYAGFELSTLPADEITEPRKTIPRAIVSGMLIVAAFYLLTNFVIVGTVGQSTLASSQAPLIDSGVKIFGVTPLLAAIAVIVVGLGAIVSIMGADESGTIGTSRLAYAMSLDGLLPKLFSRLHPKYKTPYLGLILLCTTAFVASLVGSLSDLINASVFLLSFAYLATCLSLIVLERKNGQPTNGAGSRLIIPVVGILFSLLLISQVSLTQIAVSLILMIVGVPIYVFFTPKKELEELTTYLSRNAVLKRAIEQEDLFLAHLINHIRKVVRRGVSS